MAQGPPTPPPTSTTEFQDQVRDSVTGGTGTSSGTPEENTSMARPTPVIDTYQQAFPQICEFALRGDFPALVQYAELSDLKGRNARNQTRLLVVAPLILAYLILDELTLAQLTLARFPENLRHHPLTRTIASLVTSTSECNYAQVYSHGEVLAALTQQPEFANTPLADLITSMVVMFVESFRQKIFSLLSQAFSSISITQAQIYLGLTRDQLLSATTGAWQCNPASDTLHPLGIGNPTAATNNSTPSSLGTFESVTSSLIRLEVGW